MTSRTLIGRLFGGAAFAVAGLLTLFAVSAISLALATLDFSGLLVSLVYIAVLCWPALPLFLLGRRVWKNARSSHFTGCGR